MTTPFEKLTPELLTALFEVSPRAVAGLAQDCIGQSQTKTMDAIFAIPGFLSLCAGPKPGANSQANEDQDYADEMRTILGRLVDTPPSFSLPYVTQIMTHWKELRARDEIDKWGPLRPSAIVELANACVQREHNGSEHLVASLLKAIEPGSLGGPEVDDMWNKAIMPTAKLAVAKNSHAVLKTIIDFCAVHGLFAGKIIDKVSNFGEIGNRILEMDDIASLRAFVDAGLSMNAMTNRSFGYGGFVVVESAIKHGAERCMDFIVEKTGGKLDDLIVETKLSLAKEILAHLPGRFYPLAETFIKEHFEVDDIMDGRQAAALDDYDFLFEVVRNDRPDAIDWLVDRGANIEFVIADTNGKHPLHVACEYGKEAAALRLLDRGADMEAKDYRGWRPMTYAKHGKYANLVNVLLAFQSSAAVRAATATRSRSARP